MKELIEFIARSLVDEPDKVSVTEREENGTLILTLSVAPGDMGKVIGKQGRIAKAMRTVLKSAGTKDNKNVVLDIE